MLSSAPCPTSITSACPLLHSDGQPCPHPAPTGQPSTPGKLFFMLAQVVDDPWDTRPAAGAGAQEYAWVGAHIPYGCGLAGG